MSQAIRPFMLKSAECLSRFDHFGGLEGSRGQMRSRVPLVEAVFGPHNDAPKLEDVSADLVIFVSSGNRAIIICIVPPSVKPFGGAPGRFPVHRAAGRQTVGEGPLEARAFGQHAPLVCFLHRRYGGRGTV